MKVMFQTAQFINLGKGIEGLKINITDKDALF
jgi:hypothetical protein